MNKLSREKRTQILRCLVEGNSNRSTCRITGAAKNTVVKLLVNAGKACSEYQNINGSQEIYQNGRFKITPPKSQDIDLHHCLS